MLNVHVHEKARKTTLTLKVKHFFSEKKNSQLRPVANIHGHLVEAWKCSAAFNFFLSHNGRYCKLQHKRTVKNKVGNRTVIDSLPKSPAPTAHKEEIALTGTHVFCYQIPINSLNNLEKIHTITSTMNIKNIIIFWAWNWRKNSDIAPCDCTEHQRSKKKQLHNHNLITAIHKWNEFPLNNLIANNNPRLS